MARGIYGNKGAGSEVWLSRPNRTKHRLADCRRQHVLGADLNDAGGACAQGRQQHTEIQIMCEDDPAVGRGEIEDLRIRRFRAGRPLTSGLLRNPGWLDTSPTTGSGSYQSGISRGRQRNLDFFNAAYANA
jgi:hypothetical protein